MLVKMGVPYADAWGMPVEMALDMLGVTPNSAKSKQPAASIANQPLTPSLVNPAPSAATGTRKLVAARRKSKSS